MKTWPRNIVYSDVRRGLPFPDASADAIYSSHMLEHLYFDDAQRALTEFWRLLSPEGTLRLALPDSATLAAGFLSGLGSGGAAATLAFNEGLSAHPLVHPAGLQRLTSRLGASMHRWQPTSPLVRQMLTDAGFCNVTEHSFMEGSLPDLASVEHRAESFFLEAKIPSPRIRN